MAVRSSDRKRQLARQASRRGSADFKNSFTGAVTSCVAPFERDEISLGRKIGSGSFSDVYEIQSFRLAETGSCYTAEETRKREAMAQDADAGSRYVLKRLQRNMEEAAYDMGHEAKMLGALDHPNIVKIHGICARGHDAFLDGSHGYFLILERVESTLREKIELWKRGDRSTRNPMKLLKRGVGRDRRVDSSIETAETPPSLEARMDIAASLASAIEYLHSNGLVYRDMKPENVGFDSSGNVKLLDFGLARVLPRPRALDDNVFAMSIAGSPRYSSPEVLLKQPYGTGHDVWSFSLVVWELLSLRRPFAGYKDFEQLARAVVVKEERPRLDARWPKPVKEALRRSFSVEHSQRPPMSEMRSALNNRTSVAKQWDKVYH